MAVAPDPFEYVDITGTSRRLRALVAIGYPVSDIADQMGLIPEHLMLLLDGAIPVVLGALHARAARAYDRLWSRPRHDTLAAEPRQLARRRGWVVPSRGTTSTTPTRCRTSPETDSSWTATS